MVILKLKFGWDFGLAGACPGRIWSECKHYSQIKSLWEEKEKEKERKVRVVTSGEVDI